MSLISLTFILFVIATVILYYSVPKKIQWISLLALSLVFYCSFGVWYSVFVLVTAFSAYLSTGNIYRLKNKQKIFVKENKATLPKEEIKAYKEKIKAKKKVTIVLALVMNIGIICIFKYYNFFAVSANSVITSFSSKQVIPLLNGIVAPLGISYYTFSTVGYIVDVYWDKCEHQKNFFKLLLFISFFPHITQGPIGRYYELAPQLFEEHTFTYHNYSYGLQRILWGLFKKMAIANLISPYTAEIIKHYSDYSGVILLFGMVLYAFQMYMDFSGYMDIVVGISEMLDIRLAENFIRPYFSKSIAEYWRRWHITLGSYFRDYIYYPIGVSKVAKAIGRFTEKLFGKKLGQQIPATYALLVVWLTTGLWHAASGAYLLWGLFNGLVIIFSMLMESTFEKWKKSLHIKETSFLWRAFSVVRTFIILCYFKIFPDTGTVSDGIKYWKYTIERFKIPKSFSDLFVTFDNSNCKKDYALILVFAIVIFISSLLQRKKGLRDRLAEKSIVIRWAVYFILFALILLVGVKASGIGGGFMYAQF